jgi:hypothetical protein
MQQWLPSIVVLAVGLVGLLVLVLVLLGHLRRTQEAQRRLTVAVRGRTATLRAGLDETRAWRAAHRGPAPAEEPAQELAAGAA